MSSPTTSSLEIDPDLPLAIYTICLVLLSVVICIALSFTQKRRSKWTDKIDGRPGVVPPLNLLSPTHRYMYAIAFGSLSSEMVNLIFLPSLFDSGNRYANVFLKYISLGILILLSGFLYFPIFACVKSPIRIVGYVIGTIYSILLIITKIWVVVNAGVKIPNSVVLNTRAYQICINVAVALPPFVCLAILLVWYIGKTVMEVRRIYKQEERKAPHDDIASNFNDSHVQYVHHLMKRSRQKTFLSDLFFPGLNLPFQYLVVLVVSTIGLFQLCLIAGGGISILLDYFEMLLQSIYPSESSFSLIIVDIIRKLKAVVIISSIMSTCYCYGVLFHKVFSVKKHIREIRTGKDKSFNQKVKWPSLALASAIKYSGAQIASVITAWMAYAVVLAIIGSVFVVISVDIESFGYYIYFIVMSVVLAVIITALQYAACKLFFLNHEGNWQNIIIINNRRVFNWYAYMVLLYNVAAGLVFSLLRVAGSAIVGLLAMFRMDIILFIKGFECLDQGHNMYKKFILLEEFLNNPVMHVFLGLLSKKITVYGDYSKETLSFDLKGNDKVTYPRVSKRAFNRWKVAYTLLRNPSLQQLTASNLPGPAVLVDNKPIATNSIQLDSDNNPMEYENHFHDSKPSAFNPFLSQDDDHNMKGYFD